MMNKSSVTANRTSWVIMDRSWTCWSVRNKSMITFTAQIFLITILIFAKAIKRMNIVALWTS